jgi:hypothetical protein
MQLQCAGIIDFGCFAISIGRQEINGLSRGSVDYDYTRIRDACARVSVNHSQFEGSGRSPVSARPIRRKDIFHTPEEKRILHVEV